MGVDGQSKTNCDLPDRPLQVRHDRKMAKYGRIAERIRSSLFLPSFLILFILFLSVS